MILNIFAYELFGTSLTSGLLKYAEQDGEAADPTVIDLIGILVLSVFAPVIFDSFFINLSFLSLFLAFRDFSSLRTQFWRSISGNA